MSATSISRLGKYDLIALIGCGSFAEVYRAVDASLKREVALKVLSPQLTGDPAVRAQFAREAQFVAALEHPHIVRVYEVGEDQTRHFIAMQFIAGGSLAKALEAGKPWSPDDIAPLAKGLGDALDYAHGRGVMHLDVKPSNIMLGEDGRPFLSDFGLGRVASEASLVTGVPGGSPVCMAPEQVDVVSGRDREITIAADLYSLAVVLYRLCVGRMPFEGDPRAVMYAHLDQQPPRPTLLCESLSSSVDDVLLRALAKAPGARYPDATSLVDALTEALARPSAARAAERVPEVEPLVLGDYKVRTLRDLPEGCDAAWDEAVERLYDGTIETWIRRARFVSAAQQAERIRTERANGSQLEQHVGLALLLAWIGYAADPVLSVRPAVLDFGAEEKGYGAHLPAVLTLQNAGRGLLWGEIEALTPWLEVHGDRHFMLPPSGRMAYTVECDIDQLPSGANHTDEALRVRTQAMQTVVGARVTVWGAEVVVEPPQVDFGEVADDTVVRTITVRNSGRGALSIRLPDSNRRENRSGVVAEPETARLTAGRAITIQLRPIRDYRWSYGERTARELRLVTSEGDVRIPVTLVNRRPADVPEPKEALWKRLTVLLVFLPVLLVEEASCLLLGIVLWLLGLAGYWIDAINGLFTVAGVGAAMWSAVLGGALMLVGYWRRRTRYPFFPFRERVRPWVFGSALALWAFGLIGALVPSINAFFSPSGWRALDWFVIVADAILAVPQFVERPECAQ